MRLLRTVGFALITFGIALIAIWFIDPLRVVWPWLLTLPLPLRIGAVLAAIGLTVLLISLISERVRERDADRDLRDEF